MARSERVDEISRRRFLALGIGALGGLAAGASLAACGLTPGAQGTEPARGTPGPRRLKIGVSFQVANLNPPEYGFWLTSYGASQSLYRLMPDERLVPWIASRIAPDGEEGYTIMLNPAARFHSGRRIDARTVQGCLERYVDGDFMPVPSLKGARYEIPDALTLRIRTSQPDPWLINWLSLGYYPMFDLDEVPPTPDPAALVGKPFFSGGYRVRDLTPAQMTMDAVPDAWDGAPGLDGVDVKFIRDPQARLAALQTGEIDMMLYTPAEVVPQIKATAGLLYKSASSTSRIFVVFNHERPPLNELPVRRAVALAIDRPQIAERVLNGAYDAPDSLYPAYAPWSVPGLLKTDAPEARRLLDGAGWGPTADGIRAKDGRRLSFEWLHYPQQPDSRPMSEAIQAQLRAVGIEIRLRQVDDITAAFNSKDFDSGVTFNSMQQAGDPMRALTTYFRTTSPRNHGGWGSPELDLLIDRLSVEFDAERRNEMLRQVQEIFRRDVPITFTVSRPWSVTVNTDFAEYQPTPDVDHYIVTKDTAASAKR